MTQLMNVKKRNLAGGGDVFFVRKVKLKIIPKLRADEDGESGVE